MCGGPHTSTHATERGRIGTATGSTCLERLGRQRLDGAANVDGKSTEGRRQRLSCGEGPSRCAADISGQKDWLAVLGDVECFDVLLFDPIVDDVKPR